MHDLKELFAKRNSQNNAIKLSKQRAIAERRRELVRLVNLETVFWEACWSLKSLAGPHGDLDRIKSIAMLRAPACSGFDRLAIDSTELAQRISRAAKLMKRLAPDDLQRLQANQDGDYPMIACKIIKAAAFGMSVEEIESCLNDAISCQREIPTDFFEEHLQGDGEDMRGFMGELRRIATRYTDQIECLFSRPIPFHDEYRCDAIIDAQDAGDELRRSGRAENQIMRIQEIISTIRRGGAARIARTELVKMGMPSSTVNKIYNDLHLKGSRGDDERQEFTSDVAIQIAMNWKPKSSKA